MARDVMIVYSSDREGTTAITKTAGVAANGLMYDNSTDDCELHFENDSAGVITIEIVRKPGIELRVDNLVVGDKIIATVPISTQLVLGNYILADYGNDDPDGSGIAAGKAILINITAGDGGKFWVTRKGA